MEKAKVTVRLPEVKDAKEIFKLVKSTKVLDVNSEYLYLLQTTHFAQSCSVALLDNEIVGFVSGYVLPQNPNTLFIWQVAVDEKIRGYGIAQILIKNILKREHTKDINFIHTTVSPSNKSSIRVFEKLAKEFKVKMVSKEFFKKDDFINLHEEEVLYEIGPFNILKENK